MAPLSPGSDPYRMLLSDLADEHADLDRVVSSLDDAQWSSPTPAHGWDVLDQIAHLTYFDEQATRSATDPGAFVAGRTEAMADLEGFEERTLAAGRRGTPSELCSAWRAGRAAMLEAFAELQSGDRLEWYGPPMSAMSFVTARLMETWAHGQDVVDAVGAVRQPTRRLRHIAHLGVRTRRFSYEVRGLEAPPAEVRVELEPPGGDASWCWGAEGADDRVTGSALDFCLLVTQRRHRRDVVLEAVGPLADEWLDIAQAFAGGPGPGRAPQT